MKHLLKVFLVVLTATVCFAAYAADKDEITLTVTSDGATKDEAIKNALRTAIEQTYGVFVSANTDILNDELIKDEIATVSSGNIKKFTEVAYTKNDHSHTVTLDVIVSKGKLLSYAKSNGAECELDGATLGQDIQLRLLYRQNEEKAIENLITEIKEQLPNCIDYSIELDKVSFNREEQSWAHGYNLPENTATRYDETSVSIPYKVSARINKYGSDFFLTVFNRLSQIAHMELSNEEKNELMIKAQKEAEKIIRDVQKPRMIISAKQMEKQEARMREAQTKIKQIYKKYGLDASYHAIDNGRDNSTANEYNAEFQFPFRMNGESECRRIMFRSKLSAEKLKNIFAYSPASGFNTTLGEFSIDFGVNVITPKAKDSRYVGGGRFSDRHQEGYVLQHNMWHGVPECKEGQEVYFYFGWYTLPQTDLSKIRNVKAVHN